jgi:hypothetical protein
MLHLIIKLFIPNIGRFCFYMIQTKTWLRRICSKKRLWQQKVNYERFVAAYSPGQSCSERLKAANYDTRCVLVSTLLTQMLRFVTISILKLLAFGPRNGTGKVPLNGSSTYSSPYVTLQRSKIEDWN